MNLFRKKQGDSNIRQEETAGKIAARIIRVQTRMADYLNSKTRNLSAQAKLMLFVLFCAAFAAINLYLLIQAIH
jgi:hypothetical protein